MERGERGEGGDRYCRLRMVQLAQWVMSCWPEVAGSNNLIFTLIHRLTALLRQTTSDAGALKDAEQRSKHLESARDRLSGKVHVHVRVPSHLSFSIYTELRSRCMHIYMYTTLQSHVLVHECAG